jgi:gentisate 1,2-dioxygenase
MNNSILYFVIYDVFFCVKTGKKQYMIDDKKIQSSQKDTGIIKASHVVTHRNTGLTRCCLTSLSGTGSGMVSII